MIVSYTQRGLCNVKGHFVRHKIEGWGGTRTAGKFAVVALLTLTACTKPIVQDRPVTVRIPVAQPCALPRPTEPATLKQAYPDAAWAEMDVRQKSAAVGKWGLDQQSYGRQLNAATGACQ